MEGGVCFFVAFLGGRTFFFEWPLIPLFWASGEICPGFQSQTGSPDLRASSPMCNRILTFTSGATPADLLVASMAAELFRSTYLCTNISGIRVWELECNSMFVVAYMYIKIQNKMKTVNTLMT